METKNIETAKKTGYKGDSNTEAECWINAVKKGMDMSEKARYERAKQMGFDTKNIYYHGTSNHFDRFDKSRIGENYSYSQNSGFFFTTKKSSAENYALLHNNGNKGRLLSVFLKIENPYITNTDSDYYTPADRFDISGHDMMHDVRLNKKDSILIKGTKNDDLCVVLDPSQILSIHAAFDKETELYKPEIDINETMEGFMLDFNLERNEGYNQLTEIINDYCYQEKDKKNIKDIKDEMNKIIEYFDFENTTIVKKNVNYIINNCYESLFKNHDLKVGKIKVKSNQNKY